MIKHLVVMAALAACGGGQQHHEEANKPAPAGDTLYARLGGETGVKGVVKDFVEANVAKDARINKYFVNADIPGLERKLYEQICAAAGGGCTYSGKDMKTAHVGMHITEADFNALVEDLVKALDNAHVADADKQTLLGVLGPMKPDIVGQ
ncbi:MAG TPA: group 1 truncated hemoglobin [Kofleriaceae bacterium]